MKEQIEKMLKRNLKRKLAITTATLIAFLLSANLAFAGGDYEVGNEGIKRKNSGTLEEATENLKKTSLFSKIPLGPVKTSKRPAIKPRTPPIKKGMIVIYRVR